MPDSILAKRTSRAYFDLAVRALLDRESFAAMIRECTNVITFGARVKRGWQRLDFHHHKSRCSLAMNRADSPNRAERSPAAARSLRCFRRRATVIMLRLSFVKPTSDSAGDFCNH
jgi:hypothetical protein